MYRELTADEAVHGDSETVALEERVVEFCHSQGDLALFPELTALNGNEGKKYDAFWAAADTYIKTTLTTGAEANRHGTSLYLAQPTSVRDFVESVTTLLRKTDTTAEIPTDGWVAFQFNPVSSTRAISVRYTGKLALTFVIQSRSQHNHNEDAYYCNVIELNVKAFILELSAVVLESFSTLLAKRQNEQEHDSRELDEDGHITVEDCIYYVQQKPKDLAIRGSQDDKCKVPTGEPGAPVATNVRPTGPCLAHVAVIPKGSDHGWHKTR